MAVIAQVQGVQKVYQKSKAAPPVYALRGVDLSIAAGEYVAIMGHSGSGKSTLMNILGCLDRPTAGRYFLAGHDVTELDDAAISQFRGKYLGFVFQAFNLIPQLNILQNVAVPLFYQAAPRAVRDERARWALDRVGLSERLTHRPSELSGGQQQRVAIARALVNAPTLLLADEPTGNLDTATGNAILDLFDELRAGGLTIIMVTHEPDVAARCQRVVWLRDGAVERDALNAPGPDVVHAAAS
jgi:putative ABC transport system ATP-binding protein